MTTAQTRDAAQQTFLQGLRRESGLYADTPAADADVRATLSVIKALEYLDAEPSHGDLAGDILRCRVSGGGFAGQPAGPEATVLDTVASLISLVNLGQADDDVITAGLAYAAEHAESKFDHFMLIAAHEECGRLDSIPPRSVAFFDELLPAAMAHGDVVDIGIASSALMRAGRQLPDPLEVVHLLLEGQDPDSGGFGSPVSLFGTYCVLRALALLSAAPRLGDLLTYVASLRTPLGYASAPAGQTSAGATYQVLGIYEWAGVLMAPVVSAAQSGDVAGLTEWLDSAGPLDLADARGWTLLAAAASRGQAAVVNLLLSRGANPDIRVPASDLLPVHLAAQKGDAPTVAVLLDARPAHRHATTAVNGHTVLLQCAFYGTSDHQAVARIVLDRAVDDDDLVALLAATNVRGYNALSMQDLWHNEPMRALISSYYPGGVDSDFGRRVRDASQACTRRHLLEIATPAQLSERVMVAVSKYIEDGDEDALREVQEIVDLPDFDINLLAGPLLMTPLIFACTGVDVGEPARAARRVTMVTDLLEAGADPAVVERHPMAVGAVIRASVLNNFGLLQLLAEHMDAEAFAAEMNVSPAINGLTAMHDAIHRALTSPPEALPGHIDQITWMLQRGARLDIPDNTGQTQHALALAAQGDPAFDDVSVSAVNAALDPFRPRDSD